MQYRVEELAEQAGISVELLRSYQSRGLLPQPRHQGRVAFYGSNHLQRLRRIRDLKKRGYSLRMIEGALKEGNGEGALPAIDLDGDEETLSLAELAERSRVPPAVLRSLEASGVIRPR